MRRIIYVSRWTDLVLEEPEAVLQQIIALSIHNNRMNDVTGFLIADDGLFLQALEGPTARVEETYARILKDPRHGQLTIVDYSVANARHFRDWNMCGVSLAATGAEFKKARKTLMSSQGLLSGVQALDLLRRVSLLEAERERRAALAPQD